MGADSSVRDCVTSVFPQMNILRTLYRTSFLFDFGALEGAEKCV